jgi:biotin operon repressor
MQTTYYEQQVIDYCVVNANEEQGYWACLDELPKALNLSAKQINGVITSLQNKGLAYVEEVRNASSIVWLTDKVI